MATEVGGGQEKIIGEQEALKKAKAEHVAPLSSVEKKEGIEAEKVSSAQATSAAAAPQAADQKVPTQTQPTAELSQENLDVLKLEKIREIINWAGIILIFLWMRLPLAVDMNRQAIIYILSFFIVFTIAWYHFIPKKYNTKKKVTIEIFIYTVLTAFLIHYSAGYHSPFLFFIFIPILTSAWGLGPKAVLMPVILFLIFFGIELKFFPIGIDSPEEKENTLHLFIGLTAIAFIGYFVYGLAKREHEKDLTMIALNLRLIQDEKMLREILEEAITAKQKLESANVELGKTKFNLLQTLQNITVPGRKLKYGPTIKQMEEDTGATLELISHRLNAPVTVIQGNIDMLMEGSYGKLRPEQEEALKDISAGNERLKKIIADFIDFLTLRGAPREPIFTVNLPPAIEAAIANVIQRAKEKNIQIIYQPTDLGITVEGNNERIKSALVNIFDSCLLSCPGGSKISVVHYHQKNDVIIEITYQNFYIPKENWEKVFQQFQAAEHILAGTAESTGLELHLARSFARSMGGDVFIARSEPQGGTVVVFKLKAAKYMVSQKTPSAEKVSKAKTEEKPKKPAEAEKVSRLERLKK